MSSREKNKFEHVRSIAWTPCREMKGCLVEIKTGRRNVIQGKARNHSLQESWARRDANEAGQAPRCLLSWFSKCGPGIRVALKFFCVSQKAR